MPSIERTLHASRRTLAAIFILSGVSTSSHAVSILSDFEDGTLQGWTMATNPPFNGQLVVAPEGQDSAFSMEARDTVIGPGGLWAKAPASYTGDLSVFSAVSWWMFIPNDGVRVPYTSVIIRSSLGTEYISTPDSGDLGSWRERYIPFEPGSWILRGSTGSEPFESVLSDVESLFIEMDTFGGLNPLESRVDNITLVPEPATAVLLCAGLLGLGLSRTKPSRARTRSE